MKQKLINDILYVYSLEPYIITKDTTAKMIFVQEELFDDYKRLNPSLTQLAKKNFNVLSVITPEWNTYRNIPDDDREDLDIPLNTQSTNMNGVTYNPQTSTMNVPASLTGFQMFDNNNPSIFPTYDSSNEDVATIDSDGYVEINREGMTTISASYEGDNVYHAYNEEYLLIVNSSDDNLEDPRIFVDNQDTSLYHGESLELDIDNPYNLSLMFSTNTNNLMITNSGIIYSTSEPNSTATYKVYVTFAGNETYKPCQLVVDVTVKRARLQPNIVWMYDGMQINEYSGVIECALGDESTLPTLSNPNNLSVTFSTNGDPSVISISQNGNISLLQATVNDILINATFEGNDTYRPAVATYQLSIISTSKGYAFMTTMPTQQNLAQYIKLNGVKPTQPEPVDMTSLDKPTDLYLVFPKSWEVYDSVNDQILKPVVTDTTTSGEMAIWWDSVDPSIRVNNIDYRIESIQLGKGTFTIEF